jgi:hypothetical protein
MAIGILAAFFNFVGSDAAKQPSADELYWQWRSEIENLVLSKYTPGIYPAMWRRSDASFLNAYQKMVHSTDPKLDRFLYERARNKHSLNGDCLLSYALCERMGWDLQVVY